MAADPSCKRDGQSEAGFSRGEGLTVYQLPDGTGVQWLTTAAILHI